MPTNAKISALILAHVANGMALRDAFDAVMGDGAYLALAGQVYDEIRAGYSAALSKAATFSARVEAVA